MQALRGINLGGWLVAERWMTPQIFDGVKAEGERALVRELGQAEAARRLTQHRENFITQKDFEWISRQGFDFVRLPVGYWLFEDNDGYISGEDYLKKAFTWAQKHRLGVVLDFHGLQGSQNGLDHSGEVGKVRFYQRANRKSALATMEYLAKSYGHEPALIGLEVINEPKVRWFVWRLMRYYDKAIKIIQEHTRSDIKIIVSDAYKPLRLAKALSKRRYGDRLVLDVHLYQVFGAEDKTMSIEGHIQKVQSEWATLLGDIGRQVPNILVGEWSAALPPTAYEFHGGESPELRNTYYSAQLTCFDRRVWAHAYWSYKAPHAGAWSFREIAG